MLFIFSEYIQLLFSIKVENNNEEGAPAITVHSKSNLWNDSFVWHWYTLIHSLGYRIFFLWHDSIQWCQQGDRDQPLSIGHHVRQCCRLPVLGETPCQRMQVCSEFSISRCSEKWLIIIFRIYAFTLKYKCLETFFGLSFLSIKHVIMIALWYLSFYFCLSCQLHRKISCMFDKDRTFCLAAM